METIEWLSEGNQPRVPKAPAGLNLALEDLSVKDIFVSVFITVVLDKISRSLKEAGKLQAFSSLTMEEVRSPCFPEYCFASITKSLKTMVTTIKSAAFLTGRW